MRRRTDRAIVNGSRQSKGQWLYDMTFFAPKAVSIQVLAGENDSSDEATARLSSTLASNLLQVGIASKFSEGLKR